MKKDSTILIADRNRHVRELLKREMEAESFQVMLAKSGREVLRSICHNESFDLLILDPDLPDADDSSLLKKVQDLAPTLPLVIHAFDSDYANNPAVLSAAAFVEKGGSSVELLKKVVFDILRNSDFQQT